jgi:hypothetical protein
VAGDTSALFNHLVSTNTASLRTGHELSQRLPSHLACWYTASTRYARYLAKTPEPVTRGPCGVHSLKIKTIGLVRCYVEVSIQAWEAEANQVFGTACHIRQSSPQVELHNQNGQGTRKTISRHLVVVPPSELAYHIRCEMHRQGGAHRQLRTRI